MKTGKPLDEFLSECDEWHALFFGFCSSWKFWKGLRKEKIPEEAEKTREKEYHYFCLGFLIGRGIQVAIAVICGVTLTL